MSRALDADLKHALVADQASAGQAYRDIAALLAEPRPDALVVIELLDGSHQLASGQSLKRRGLEVGVSKLRLVQAFGVARQVLLLQRQHDAPADLTAVSRGAAAVSEADIESATAVLLLQDPEHLTAANTRKRVLLQRLAVAVGSKAETELMDRELALVDSLVTSYLFRHAKSPTLWSHRRWLLELSHRLCLNPQSMRDGGIREVVMKAARKHPRNYYAWQHARWLLGWGGSCVLSAELAHHVVFFCTSNHSDISGWAFLAAVLAALQPATAKQTPPPPPVQVWLDIVEHITTLAEFMEWRNESVLWFLRAVSQPPDGSAQPVPFDQPPDPADTDPPSFL